MGGHVIDEHLIAFAADDLATDAAAEIAAHVAGCPACAATVARYRLVRTTLRADASLAPPPTTLARAKAIFRASRPAPSFAPLAALRRVVAQLTYDSRGAFAPGLAGVRGAGAAQLAYTSELADVDLQLDRLPDPEAERWQIMGQVVPVDETSEASPVRVALTMTGSDQPIAETAADEVGVFTLEALAGRYDLLLQVANQLLVLAGLDVG